MKTEKGFTLIELLLYLSITAIVELRGEKQEYKIQQNEINQTIQEIRKLKNTGYTSQQIQAKLMKSMTSISPEIFKEIYGEEESSKIFEEFNLPKESSTPSMLWLLLIVPGFFLVWLISQIPKWIFYYIYLGKIKPEK